MIVLMEVTTPGTVEGALTALGIGLGIVLLVIVAVVLLIRSGSHGLKLADASIARSVPGIAVVRAVGAEPYDAETSHRPYRVDLLVQPDGMAHYETQVVWNIGLLGAASVQPGNEVSVRVDPADPRLVRPYGVDMQIKATFEHAILKRLGVSAVEEG